MGNRKCDLKHCTGTLRFYDGAMGYEAMVCSMCGSHYTGSSSSEYNISVITQKYAQVVRKNKR